jgi:hypothetical protein
MRAALPFLLSAGGALGAILPALASAQDVVGTAPVLEVSGSCPESAAVLNVLTPLLPTNQPAGSNGTATVSDRGASYVVAVGGRSKTYSDAARNCAERARVAAAFISLALVPDALPERSTLPADAGPQPSSPAPNPPEAPSPEPAWVRVDLRGMGESAPESGLLTTGIALGVTGGKGRFGAQLMCWWAAGASMSARGTADGSIVIERFPCALGPLVRLTPIASLVELSLSTSVVLGALWARGTGFVSDYDAVRLDVGARVSVDAILRATPQPGSIAPVLGIQIVYDPMTYDLDVMPRGVVGHTPSLWAGVSAGISWGVP